jgi:hypothetical protein
MTLSDSGDFTTALIQPLNWMRENGRMLSVLSVSLIIFFPFGKTGFLITKPSVPLFVFFLLQAELLIFDFFRDSGLNSNDILFRLIIDSVFFVAFVLRMPCWIETSADVKWFVRSAAFGGVMFILISFVQFLADPARIVWMGRFIGVSEHPNFAGVVFSMTMIFSVWLIENSKGIFEKIFWIFLVIVCGLGVVWTGSRTSCLMVAAGMAVFMFSDKKWKVFVFAILAGIFVIWQLSSFAEFSEPINRLVGGENTREEAWGYLFSQYASHPFFGMPTNEIKFSENSYLLIGLRGGILALIMIFFVLFFIGKQSWLFFRNPTHGLFGVERLFFSSMFALFVGSLFEGFLNMTIGYQILLFYSLAGMQNVLRLRSKAISESMSLAN